MIRHKIKVQHTVTYEAEFTVADGDERKARIAAEQNIFVNPDMGRIVERKVVCTSVVPEFAPDPVPAPQPPATQ